MAVRNILRAIEIRVISVGPTKDYSQLGFLYLNAGYILGVLGKFVDSIRFINSGLMIFEDLENTIQQNQINYKEVGQSIIDNVYLMIYIKGESNKDVEINVP